MEAYIAERESDIQQQYGHRCNGDKSLGKQRDK